jgi:capsular polysaccharide transport system permease protein
MSKFRTGARLQARVIGALMVRELITRFGRENIGFLSIMLEPLLFAVLVGIMWRFMKGPEEHGVGVVAFVVSGYIPLVLFRSAVQRALLIFTANGSLLYHRQIKIVDLVLVRFLTEFIGHTMAYIFIGTVLVVIGEFPLPSDLGYVLYGWFAWGLFTLSICLIVAPLSEVSEVLEKIMPVTVYLMIPFSGTFNMTSWLVPAAQRIMLYSPPVNCMEIMRHGIFGTGVTAYYDLAYPVEVSTVCILVGLLLCRRVRRTLVVE